MKRLGRFERNKQQCTWYNLSIVRTFLTPAKLSLEDHSLLISRERLDQFEWNVIDFKASEL